MADQRLLGDVLSILDFINAFFNEWLKFNFPANVDPCNCWTWSPVPSELRVDPVCLKTAAASLSRFISNRGLFFKKLTHDQFDLKKKI